VVLLEVLVALMVLAASGFTLAELVGSGLRSEADARAREGALATEERVFTALCLLGRGDLDRRLGRHRLGEFVTDVGRPERSLYRIALADTIAPEVDALVTVVYRPETTDVP
jgi:hypothetical protein